MKVSQSLWPLLFHFFYFLSLFLSLSRVFLIEKRPIPTLERIRAHFFKFFWFIFSGYTALDWVFLGSTGFYWVLLGFSAIDQVLLAFPVLGCALQRIYEQQNIAIQRGSWTDRRCRSWLPSGGGCRWRNPFLLHLFFRFICVWFCCLTCTFHSIVIVALEWIWRTFCQLTAGGGGGGGCGVFSFHLAVPGQESRAQRPNRMAPSVRNGEQWQRRCLTCSRRNKREWGEQNIDEQTNRP